MKFKVGDKVRVVTDAYSEAYFEKGDIVTIRRVGSDFEADVYGAISPYDNNMWWLYEDEVEDAGDAIDPNAFNPFYDSKFLISIDGNENFGQRMLVEMYPGDLKQLRDEINLILAKQAKERGIIVKGA